MLLREAMNSLTPDILMVIASFLDSKSIMNLGVVCRENKVLVPFARRVLDCRSYQCVNGMLNKCVSTLNIINDKRTRLEVCQEILQNLDKAVTKFIIYGSINLYVSQYGDAMNTTVLKDTLDLMRTIKNKSNVHIVWSQFTQAQKMAWSMFEDFWLGQRTYVNLTWVVETIEGDEIEASINIGNIDDGLTLTIYNGVDCSPFVSFDINDSKGIVSYVQENTYLQFFEDAKYQCILLKNDVQENMLNRLRDYDYIRPSIDNIMDPINRLMR